MSVLKRQLCSYQIVFALIAVLLVGCGGKPSEVSGVVTLDGQPLSHGMIGFTPVGGGMRAAGEIKSDGGYTLSTNRELGLEPGEYTVTVVSRERGIVSPDSSGPPLPGPYITPKRYAVDSTSGLKFTVERGDNTIDIPLTSDAKGVASATPR